MKRFIAPMLIGATLATAAVAGDDSLKAEIEALKAQMAELKEAQSKVNYDALKKQLSEVKAHSAGDNVKFSVDFRSAYDYVDYKTGGKMMIGMNPATGAPVTMDRESKKVTNGIWTNKLILNMAAQPVDNLVFKGALAAYSTYGQDNISPYNFQGFDWYGTQKPNGTEIKLREAYFLYFGDMGDMPYTVSFGRRPSTDGFMTNLREDNEHPASPIGHNINMEFDGASFKFDFDKLTGVSGLYFKLCIGRGFSETMGSYDMSTGKLPYEKDGKNPNMDLIGLLAQLYDDGQYKVLANYFQGYNMMGMGMDMTMNFNPLDGNYYVDPTSVSSSGFTDVGDLSGGALSLQVNGIGDEWSDFLDDTIFFASYAFSKTKPNNKQVNNITFNDSTGTAPMPDGTVMQGGEGMLGSTSNETGYSYYVGLNIPGFMESDRFGFEYNYGSEYWRSFTYGEDTLAGSKLATRGNAYEVYYNFPLVGKNLTGQLRYTQMDYKYGGSDMFFGQSGDPAYKNIDTAKNIRAYLRYRY